MSLTHTVTGINLSDAWAKAFLEAFSSRGQSLSPAVVEFPVNEDIPLENIMIRDELSKFLGGKSNGIDPIETVANTIFPESLLKLSKGDREEFFAKYTECLPRVRKCHGNSYGVYFERMIGYDKSGEKVNQLEHIINTWNGGNHRGSALQIAVFDPRVDHSNMRQRGFPCLQQIALHPEGANGENGLALVGFYATQTLVEKAYGNYLGLYRLGAFLAKEMGMTLRNVVCVAASLKLSANRNKSECEILRSELNKAVTNGE